MTIEFPMGRISAFSISSLHTFQNNIRSLYVLLNCNTLLCFVSVPKKITHIFRYVVVCLNGFYFKCLHLIYDSFYLISNCFFITVIILQDIFAFKTRRPRQGLCRYVFWKGLVNVLNQFFYLYRLLKL